MVVDTSAIAAIFFGEDDAELYLDAIASAPSVSISAATLVEASIVSTRGLGRSGIHDLNVMVSQSAIRIVPVDEAMAQLAVSAWTRFGKGNHPASLNYGDCFSYALAITLGEPLLFKGNNFQQTDVRSVLQTSWPSPTTRGQAGIELSRSVRPGSARPCRNAARSDSTGGAGCGASGRS